MTANNANKNGALPGSTIELPWWSFVLMLPPFGVLVGAIAIPQQWWMRVFAAIPAILLMAAIVRVSVRVQNSSMQSVWISLWYGLWAIFPVAWVVALVTTN